MTEYVSVPLDDVRRVFRLLGEVQDLLHQEMKFRDPEYVTKFAYKHYPELRKLYYTVVRDWLPEDVEDAITSGNEEALEHGAERGSALGDIPDGDGSDPP